MYAEPNTKIVFKGKISKSGDKLLVIIPRKFYMMVHHGKEYIITLEEVEGKEGE